MKFSRRLRKSISRGLLIIVIAVLTIIFSNVYQKEVRNFFYKISEPIQRSFWIAGGRISNFFEAISQIQNLKKENEELRLKIKELLAKIANLEELKKENVNLRKALNIGLQKEFDLTLAQVISKDISKDSISINKGKEDGLSKGLPVITEQKVLLGEIYEVYKNYSKVRLISNKESSFDGEIVGKGTLGQVKGEGNSKILFDLISPEQEVKEKDLIETSALGGEFPKGLIVGEIKKVQKSDVQPLYQAEVSSLFDIGKLETVFVILNFKPSL